MSALADHRKEFLKAFPPKKGCTRYFLAFDIPSEADPIQAQLDYNAPDGYDCTALYQGDINLQTALLQEIPRGKYTDWATVNFMEKNNIKYADGSSVDLPSSGNTEQSEV